MTTVTIDDVRKAGFCCHGTRLWVTRHKLDMRAFVADGIDVSDISHITDAKVDKVIRIAKAREAANGNQGR